MALLHQRVATLPFSKQQCELIKYELKNDKLKESVINSNHHAQVPIPFKAITNIFITAPWLNLLCMLAYARYELKQFSSNLAGAPTRCVRTQLPRELGIIEDYQDQLNLLSAFSGICFFIEGYIQASVKD